MSLSNQEILEVCEEIKKESQRLWDMAESDCFIDKDEDRVSLKSESNGMLNAANILLEYANKKGG